MQACKGLPGCAADHPNQNPDQPGDVVTALVWDLAGQVCSVPLGLAALQAAHSSLQVGFPKFKALLDILQDMVATKASFHGIVFVRQRRGVHAVSTLLRNVPGCMEGVHVHTFTGHASQSKSQSMRDGVDSATAGMQGAEQQATLERFSVGTGREVLVATAAAQEGLDITNCSFVVCYNVTERGVQLMQWRGRTRKPDSQIFMVLQTGSLDELLYSKSCLEENNDRLAQLRLGQTTS